MLPVDHPSNFRSKFDHEHAEPGRPVEPSYSTVKSTVAKGAVGDRIDVDEYVGRLQNGMARDSLKALQAERMRLSDAVRTGEAAGVAVQVVVPPAIEFVIVDAYIEAAEPAIVLAEQDAASGGKLGTSETLQVQGWCAATAKFLYARLLRHNLGSTLDTIELADQAVAAVLLPRIARLTASLGKDPGPFVRELRVANERTRADAESALMELQQLASDLDGVWRSERPADASPAALNDRELELLAQRVAEKVVGAVGSNGAEVVLWEGAAHSDRNVRLARTRSAYLEAHGDVQAAMQALKQSRIVIGRSTFYDHLKALDSKCPGWRTSTLVSGASRNPKDNVRAGTPGKTRAKSS